MSILDGMISSEAELKAALEKAAPMAADMLTALNLNERTQSVIDLMNEGLSLGDILGVTRQHRDAMLVTAGRLLQSGDALKAREMLTMLYQFEPTDERSIYLLAATFQVQGDFATAAKLYIHFLALDATNPEGYLRLGECLLGAGESTEARESFENALAMAQSAGNVPAADLARRMIALTQDNTALN